MARRRKLRVWGARSLGKEGGTEDFFDVVAPDEGGEDVGEEIGCLEVVFACDVAVRDASDEGEGLEGQHGYD